MLKLSMRKCNVAMLNVKYQGGNGTNNKEFMTKLQNAWKAIGEGPTKWDPKPLIFQNNLHDLA